MPGKVNPSQQEAMVMVCVQVIGEDDAAAFAGGKSISSSTRRARSIINNFLHAARILGDACEKLRHFSVEATSLNRVDETVGCSLVLVAEFGMGLVVHVFAPPAPSGAAQCSFTGGPVRGDRPRASKPNAARRVP
jgi:fumarate hydratase class II